jgi:hypothetical protein
MAQHGYDIGSGNANAVSLLLCDSNIQEKVESEYILNTAKQAG